MARKSTAQTVTVTDDMIAAFADAHSKIELVNIATERNITIVRNHPKLTIAQTILTALPALAITPPPATDAPAADVVADAPAADVVADAQRIAAIAAMEGELTVLTENTRKNVRDLALALGRAYILHPWTDKNVSIADYVTGYGIYAGGFTFGDSDREAMFRVIMDAGVKATVTDLMALSGTSKSSVIRTRTAIGMANPNMVNGQNGAGDGDGEGAGDGDKAPADPQTKALADLGKILPKLDREHLRVALEMVSMALATATQTQDTPAAA